VTTPPEPVEHRILAVNVGERLELVLLASVGVVDVIGRVADLQTLAESHAPSLVTAERQA